MASYSILCFLFYLSFFFPFLIWRGCFGAPFSVIKVWYCSWRRLRHHNLEKKTSWQIVIVSCKPEHENNKLEGRPSTWPHVYGDMGWYFDLIKLLSSCTLMCHNFTFFLKHRLRFKKKTIILLTKYCMVGCRRLVRGKKKDKFELEAIDGTNSILLW